jgi:Fe-S-cluster containining protein
MLTKPKPPDPEQADFGYCIPDCGRCCGGPLISYAEAKQIARFLGCELFEFSEMRQTGLALKKVAGHCILLYGPSLCSVYDVRPKVCCEFPRDYIDCYSHWNIELLEYAGIKIKSELKNMWLERYSDNYYSRLAWLREAREHLDRAVEANCDKFKEVLRKSLARC